MTDSHIKWRVKETPQMSADVFAQYMSIGDKKRDELAQSCRYQPVIPRGYHVPTRNAVKTFLGSKTRDWSIIGDVSEALTKRAAHPGLHPKMRERLLTNVNALASFQNGFNALGVGRFKLGSLDPKQPKLKIGGLKISVSLDFLVHSVDQKHQDRLGGLLFSFSKRAEPQKIQSTARYERLARHATVLIHMHLTDHFSALGKPFSKHCLWIDNHLQRSHAAPSDYKSLMGDMQVAGARIVKEWEDIKPPVGFDPAFAEYVS